MSRQCSKIVLYLLVGGLVVGCRHSGDSFEEAILKAKDINFSKSVVRRETLPYYTYKTLTPVWDFSQQSPVLTMPQIHLLDHRGQAFTEQKFSHKNTVVAFLFTSCLGFCPLLVKKLKDIESAAGSIDNLQFAIVSVDPEVDTPEVLSKYAAKHRVNRPSWSFVTGKKQDIYNLIRDTFASEVRRLESKNMRKFAHTEHFYLVDGEGRLRAIFNGTRVDMSMLAAKTIKRLHNEREGKKNVARHQK